MNQTALEYLISELKKSKDYQRVINDVNHSGTEQKDIIEQAKAMEKEQIIEAYDYEANADMHDYSSGEQYYDQRFNK